MNNIVNLHKDIKPSRAEIYKLYAMGFYQDMHAVYFGGCLYTYEKNHYRPAVEPDIALHQWFIGQEIPSTNSIAVNTLSQLKALAMVEGADLPFWRDSRESAKAVIPFANGLLRDGELTPHTPDLVCTYCLPYPYLTDATCPRWLTFLDQVFDGDTARVSLLQEWCGYCLTADTSLQKFMVLCGLPRSGKGTVSNVLAHLVGLENMAAFDLYRLLDRFSMATLRSKQLAFIGEVELTGSRDKGKILERLKSIVGNDPQIIERKGVDVKESAVIPAKLLMNCNTMPALHDVSGALEWRMLLLNFNTTFAGREDPDLLGKLLPELSGIAVWALAGLSRLREKGWTQPAQSVASKQEFRRSSAPALAFLQDCCAVRRDWLSPLLPSVEAVDDHDVFVTRQALQNMYHLWCGENGYTESNFNWVTKDLRALLPHLGLQDRATIDGQRSRIYRGLSVKGSAAVMGQRS